MVLATPAWGDLRLQTEITYTADVSEGNLLLESQIRLTNLTPDESDGLQIIRYFYDHIQIRVPETVQGFRATSGGSDLGFSLQSTGQPEDEGFLLATIGLGRRLVFEESMDLAVSYQIPGDLPRSETTFRITPAYITFGVAGWGDPGGVTVNVIAPGFAFVGYLVCGWGDAAGERADALHALAAEELLLETPPFGHVHGQDQLILGVPHKLKGFDLLEETSVEDDATGASRKEETEPWRRPSTSRPVVSSSAVRHSPTCRSPRSTRRDITNGPGRSAPAAWRRSFTAAAG